LAVHAIDGGLGFSVAAHFDKAEAFGAACVALHHHLGTADAPEGAEGLFQIVVTHAVGQVAHVQFVAH
jgi:hypothetical protein